MVGMYLRQKAWFSCLQDNRQVKLHPNLKGFRGFPSLGFPTLKVLQCPVGALLLHSRLRREAGTVVNSGETTTMSRRKSQNSVSAVFSQLLAICKLKTSQTGEEERF